MPSVAQLAAEAAYRDEVVPPALAEMGRTVRTALGLSAGAIGFKGNELHLNGAHRSRRWILTSAWCTDRSYTVSYPDDRLGDEDWIAGCDITASSPILLPMCQRLDRAVRAGELEELAAWYGNVDGDSRVDGYNNILNRVASADSSHLWHLHLTILRRYANDAPFMRRLAAVLIGADDMSWDETIGADYAPPGFGQHKFRTAMGYSWAAAHEAKVGVARVEAALAAIAAKVDISPDELAAIKDAAEAGAKEGVAESMTAEAIAAAIPDDLAAEVVERLAARLAS